MGMYILPSLFSVSADAVSVVIHIGVGLALLILGGWHARPRVRDKRRAGPASFVYIG